MLNNLILDREPSIRGAEAASSLRHLALALAPKTSVASRGTPPPADATMDGLTMMRGTLDGDEELPDFIAAADDVKSLLQLPYSARPVSQVVHRIGSTLILGGEVDASNSCQLDAVIARRTPSPLLCIAAARTALSDADAVSAAAAGADFVPSADAGADGSADLGAAAAPGTTTANGGATTASGFLRIVRWTPPGTELRMTLGSNLVTMASGSHHEVAVRLQDVDAPPLSPETGLDYYLDNVMAGVPELALCFHDDGTYRGSKTIKTEDIPMLAPPGRMLFSPELVYSNGATILRFLKANCATDLESYWLRRDDGDDSMRLFNLSSLLAEDGVPISLRAGANKWRYMMAMMCLRYARHTKRAIGAEPAESHRRQRDLLHKALALLTELAATGGKKHASIRASTHEQIADTFIAAAAAADGGDAEDAAAAGGAPRGAVEGDAPLGPAPPAKKAGQRTRRQYQMDQQQRAVKHLGNAIRTLRELADDDVATSMMVSSQVVGLQSKQALCLARLAGAYSADGQITRGLETMEKLLALQAEVVRTCTMRGPRGDATKSIESNPGSGTSSARAPAGVTAIATPLPPSFPPPLTSEQAESSDNDRASRAALHLVHLEVLRLRAAVRTQLRAWCTSEDAGASAAAAAVADGELDELEPLPELVSAYTLLERCGDLLLNAGLRRRSQSKARARDDVDDFSLSDLPELSRFLRELAPAVVVATQESEVEDELSSPTERRLLDVIDGSAGGGGEGGGSENGAADGGKAAPGPLVESVEQFLLLGALCFRAARAMPPPPATADGGTGKAGSGLGAESRAAVAGMASAPTDAASATASPDASAIFISSTAGRKLGSTHNELARFYLEKGRLVDATRAFKTALVAFGAVGDRVNVALIYVNLAHTMKTMATAEAEARRATVEAMVLAARQAAAADASSDCDESAAKAPACVAATEVMASSLTVTQRAHYERAIEFCDLAEAVLRSGSKKEKQKQKQKEKGLDAELLRVWHKVRSQLAMVHLIYGVRLGRWLFEVRSERAAEGGGAGGGASSSGSSAASASSDLLEETERRVFGSLDAALRVYTEARDEKQVAAVHFQMGRVYRQLFEVECTRRAALGGGAAFVSAASKAKTKAQADETDSVGGLPTRRLRALFTVAGRHYVKAAALFREQRQVRTVVIVQLDVASLHLTAATACACESRDRRRERQQLELALGALVGLADAFEGSAAPTTGAALRPTDEQRSAVLSSVSAALQALLRSSRADGDAKSTARYKGAYGAVLRGQRAKSLTSLLRELGGARA